MKRRLLILGVGVIVAGIGIFLIVGQLVPSDDPVEGETPIAFPTLKGTNLLLSSVTVPADLDGELRLIVVAYDSDQQVYVEKWLRPLEALNERYPQLAGYYVPLLPQETADAALPIIGGMTLAAQNDRDRARTIVVFTDVEAFNRIVGVPNGEEIQLFLLDSAGNIQWRGTGSYRHETLAALEDALQRLSQVS